MQRQSSEEHTTVVYYAVNNTTETFVKREALLLPLGLELMLNKLFRAHDSDKNLPQQKSHSGFFFLSIVSGYQLLALPALNKKKKKKIRYPFDLLVPNPATFRAR